MTKPQLLLTDGTSNDGHYLIQPYEDRIRNLEIKSASLEASMNIIEKSIETKIKVGDEK